MMAQTTLPGNLGTLDWSSWTRGIATSFIGGGAGAVSAGFGTMIVDPKDFSVYTGKLYVVMLVSFAFSGTMSMMQFLHTKPIPDLKQVETTTKTIAPDMGPATTITTVKETHVEPIAPKQDA